MRHLRLDAMFHLLWALVHTIEFMDKPAVLSEISRSNLQPLSEVFGDVIEHLDPSNFWPKVGRELRAESVDGLASWNDYIDGYMNHQCEWPPGVLAAAIIAF